MPAIMCKITEPEIILLTKIADYMQEHKRSPKAREIVPSINSKYRTAAERDQIKSFERLVVLGAIERSRNGHCWLRPSGQRLVQA